jgi:ankyrin repeat protein
MKLLTTTIAAVLVVGCGPKVPDITIHQAAFGGNIEAVKQHLDAGADVNAKDGGEEGGGTPLHRATYQGYKEIAELLIANGADVNAQNDYGETPLDYDAWYNSETEIADLLREHGGKHGVINGAAAGGDIEAVKEFLVAGTEVNAKDEDGWTPLHSAASWGGKEITELLIANGADVNAKDDGGNTPLDWAVDSAHSDEETAALLRKHGGKTGEELKAEGK